MDNDGIIGLAGAVQGFAKGMMDREDRDYRKMEMAAKIEAQKQDRERERLRDEVAKRDKEFDNRAKIVSMGKKLPTLAEGQSVYDVPLESLQTDYDYLGAKAMASAAADPFGAKAADAAKKKDDERKLGTSPVPGYEKGPNYVGDEVEERTLRAAHTDFKKFQTTMTALRNKVKAAKEIDLANPLSDVRKAIANDLRDLQLTYKGDAFAKLGVLTGPDMSILEQIIENPGTVSNLISGKDGVVKRYDQALGRVNQAFDAKINSMGLVPVQAPGGGLIQPAGSGLIPRGKIAKPAANGADAERAAKLKRLQELEAKAQGG